VADPDVNDALLYIAKNIRENIEKIRARELKKAEERKEQAIYAELSKELQPCLEILKELAGTE